MWRTRAKRSVLLLAAAYSFLWILTHAVGRPALRDAHLPGGASLVADPALVLEDAAPLRAFSTASAPAPLLVVVHHGAFDAAGSTGWSRRLTYVWLFGASWRVPWRDGPFTVACG